MYQMKITQLEGLFIYQVTLLFNSKLIISTLIRNAVDFGIPLVNNALLAELWVEALGKKIAKGELVSYSEGRIPPEVQPWSHWVGGHF